jgi:hypothetical protein
LKITKLDSSSFQTHSPADRLFPRYFSFVPF